MIYQLGRLVKDVNLTTTDINGAEKKVFNNVLAIRIDQEKTAYIDVTAWGNVAENLSKYFKKGNEVLLRGEIRNKKNTIEGKEINVVFMLITGFEFTYGNKKEQENI